MGIRNVWRSSGSCAGGIARREGSEGGDFVAPADDRRVVSFVVGFDSVATVVNVFIGRQGFEDLFEGADDIKVYHSTPGGAFALQRSI